MQFWNEYTLLLLLDLNGVKAFFVLKIKLSKEISCQQKNFNKKREKKLRSFFN